MTSRDLVKILERLARLADRSQMRSLHAHSPGAVIQDGDLAVILFPGERLNRADTSLSTTRKSPRFAKNSRKLLINGNPTNRFSPETEFPVSRLLESLFGFLGRHALQRLRLTHDLPPPLVMEQRARLLEAISPH